MPKRSKVSKTVQTSKTAAATAARQDKTRDRQIFLMQLLRRGIRQPDQIVEMYRKKGYDIAERTIRDDRLAVRALIEEQYGDAGETTKAQFLAEYDDLEIQFQQIAQQALNGEGKRSYYAAVQALGQKKDVITARAKLAGVVVDKQEVTGEMRSINVNVEAKPSDLIDLWKAAKKAGMTDEEAQAALEPPTN